MGGSWASMPSPAAVVVPEMLPAGQGLVPPTEEDHRLWKCPQYLLCFCGGCFASVFLRACFRAPGLPLTLGGVEHPFGLHLYLKAWSAGL